MQTLEKGYRAMGVLWSVNWERLFFPIAILLCLSLWHYIGAQGFFWF